MNTTITLQCGRRIDVKDIVGYSVDARLGSPCNAKVTLKNGEELKVSIEDVDCIEVFRRELKQIKHEE